MLGDVLHLNPIVLYSTTSHCADQLRRKLFVPLLWQDGEVRRSFQRSLQKQGLKFKLGTKVSGLLSRAGSEQDFCSMHPRAFVPA